MGHIPSAGYLWPEGVPTSGTLEDYTKAFEAFGFARCGDGSLEPGFEKIVLYGRAGFADHAARQLPNGKWTSKLGIDGEDVEHDSPEVVAAGRYGRPLIFMRRAAKTPA